MASNDSYEEQLRQLFNSCDSDDCGFLDRSQLFELTEKLQLDEDQTNYIADNLISDDFSKINFDEFKDVFVSLLTQTQPFAANQSNNNNNGAPTSVSSSSSTTLTSNSISCSLTNAPSSSSSSSSSLTTTTTTLDAQSTSKPSVSVQAAPSSSSSSTLNESHLNEQMLASSHDALHANNMRLSSSSSSSSSSPSMTAVSSQTLPGTSTSILSSFKKMKMKKKSTADDEPLSDHHLSKCDVESISGSSNTHSSQSKKMKNSVSLSSTSKSSSSSSSTSASSSLVSVSASSVNTSNKNDASQSNTITTNTTSTPTLSSSSSSPPSSLTVNNNINDTSIETMDSAESYLKAIWQQLGVGRNGYLTLKELFVVCEHIQLASIDQDLIEQLFDRLDSDRDGKISFDELLKQMTTSVDCESSYVSTTPTPKPVNQRNMHLAHSDDLQPSSLEYVYANSTSYSPTTGSVLCSSNASNSLSTNHLQSGFLLSDSSSNCSSTGSSPIPPSGSNSCSQSYDCSSLLPSQSVATLRTNNNNNNTNTNGTTTVSSMSKVKSMNSSNSINRSSGQLVTLTPTHDNLNNRENNKENQPINNRFVDRNHSIGSSNVEKPKSDPHSSSINRKSNLFNRDTTNGGGASSQLDQLNGNVFESKSNRTQMCQRRASTGSAGGFSPSPPPHSYDDSTQPTSLPPLDFDLNSLPPARLIRRCSLQKSKHQLTANVNSIDVSNNSSSGPTSLPLNTNRSQHVPLPFELGSTNNGSGGHTFTTNNRKKMTDDEDYSSQNGFGHFLSLDPFNCGYVKVSNLLNLWEQLGVCNGKYMLEELGVNWKTNRISTTELSHMLDETVHCATNFSPDRDLFRASFALIRNEIKFLRYSYEQIKEERDKLRLSIMEANNRADMLAQEVDENHAKLEQSTQSKLMLMEKKYQEQLRTLQEEIQNERELANLQMLRLRSDCEQQVRAMQQVHNKCKDYCLQLEHDNKRLDKDLQECSSQLAEASKSNAEIQRELQDAIVIKKKLTELESMQNLAREHEYELLMQKLDFKCNENKELQDKNDELQMEIEQLRLQVQRQENRRRNRRRRNSSDGEADDLINYEPNSLQLNHLLFVS